MGDSDKTKIVKPEPISKEELQKLEEEALEKLKKNQALKAQQEARLPLKQRLLNLATSGSKDSITDYLQEDLISTGKTAGEVQAELSLPENQEFINRISKAKGEAEVKTLLKNLRAGKKVAAGVGEGAKTGLASVVTGICLLLTTFLSPLVAVIP